MGRKQIVVLQALARLKTPVTIKELAEKGLQAEGREEKYATSDLRSAYRRLSNNGFIKLSKKTVGEVEVEAAAITQEGRDALKEALNPTPKEKPKPKEKAAAAKTDAKGKKEKKAAKEAPAAEVEEDDSDDSDDETVEAAAVPVPDDDEDDDEFDDDDEE